MSLPKSIKTESYRVGTVSLLDDDTVLYNLNDDVEINVDDVYEMIHAHQKIAGDKPRYVIVITGARTSQNSEARHLNISEERKKLTLAEAVVIDNIVTRISAGFYYRFNAPPYSIRTFPNADEAMKWINNLRVQDQNKRNDLRSILI